MNQTHLNVKIKLIPIKKFLRRYSQKKSFDNYLCVTIVKYYHKNKSLNKSAVFELVTVLTLASRTIGSATLILSFLLGFLLSYF